MRPHLATLLLLTLAACADPSTVVIKLGAPATLALDKLNGTLALSLLDGDSGAALQQAQVAAASLASRQRLFEGLDLEPGRSYRVKVVVTLAKGGPCGAGGKVSGQSPLFRNGDGEARVGVYLDCADRSSATGALSAQRVYHSATLVNGATAAGEVLVAGGSKLSIADINDLTRATIHETVEAYDPLAGTFSLLPARLSQRRIWHRAVPAPGGGGALLTGGVYVKADKKGLVPLDLVESFRRGSTAGKTSMLFARYAHAAVMVSPDRLLLAGGAASLYAAASAELYDPAKGMRVGNEGLKLAEPRTSPQAVAFGDGRRALLVGGQLYPKATPVQEEIFHMSGKAPCGKAPCFQPIAGFGLQVGRHGAAAARVPCSGGGTGAIYVTGGTVVNPTNKQETHLNEIHCLDTAAPTRLVKVGQLHTYHTGHSATVVRGPGGSRRLLVAGGTATAVAMAELVPVKCTCAAIKKADIKQVKMQEWRSYHTATKLRDGTVLFTGGFLQGSAERFNPAL